MSPNAEAQLLVGGMPYGERVPITISCSGSVGDLVATLLSAHEWADIRAGGLAEVEIWSLIPAAPIGRAAIGTIQPGQTITLKPERKD